MPFPKDGNPFSDGWEPFYRGMGIHFSEGWEGLLRGSGDPFAERMGTAFPKDAWDHHFPKDGTKQRSNLPAAFQNAHF